MNGYITKLNGTPIYAISAKEYIKMRLETIDIYNAEYIYMIVDKNNYLIQGNRVMGQAKDHCRRVKMLNGGSWMDFLKVEIDKYQASVKVISERPTIEFLSTTAEKKLNEVIVATKNTVETLSGSGEAALNAVANAGAEALKMQIEAGEAAVAKHKSSTNRSRARSRKNVE